MGPYGKPAPAWQICYVYNEGVAWFFPTLITSIRRNFSIGSRQVSPLTIRRVIMDSLSSSWRTAKWWIHSRGRYTDTACWRQIKRKSQRYSVWVWCDSSRKPWERLIWFTCWEIMALNLRSYESFMSLYGGVFGRIPNNSHLIPL